MLESLNKFRCSMFYSCTSECADDETEIVGCLSLKTYSTQLEISKLVNEFVFFVKVVVTLFLVVAISRYFVSCCVDVR